MTFVTTYKELNVWKDAMDIAMQIFQLSKCFPVEERYSLTDQVRRSSRSVATNISEAWRKRRYIAAFRSKLNDCETEAAETQCWIEFARRCGYCDDDLAYKLDSRCEDVLGQLAAMIRGAESWCRGF